MVANLLLVGQIEELSSPYKLVDYFDFIFHLQTKAILS